MHTTGELRIKGPSSGKVKGVDDGGDYAIVNEAGEIIGEAINRTGPTTYAPARENAQLWAAAGTMLDALEIALATIDRLTVNFGTFNSTKGTRDVIKAAIAKAKGGPA